MGFYVRKSLRAGPFRFNLSKSGIGVSAGVPGFRVGAGPRGNYVQMGRGGLYYRSTLSSGSRRGGGRRTGGPVARPANPPTPITSDVILEDITGASVEALASSHPSDLVSQLQDAAKRPPLAPLAAIALILIAIAGGVVGLIIMLVGIPAVVWLGLRDSARRSVVVFYDVKDAPAQHFQGIVDAMQSLAQCQRLWYVNAAGQVRTTQQYKVNSGASKIVSRRAAKAATSAPKHLVTNITVPTLTGGKSTLYFLPDRVLLREGKRYADLPYSALSLTAEAQRFIESDRVPSDSQQVDTTWQYVNVKGGPDRRYKNNRQLPVMLYGRLTLTSPQGLHLVFDASRLTAVQEVAAATSTAARSAVPVIQP